MKKIPDDIKQFLDYSIVSGRFYWKVKPAVCVDAGDRAGAITRRDRYVQIQINGRQYAAHRIAWKIVCGEDPTGPIDHINHDESCNGFHNLRVVTHLENSRHRRVVANTGHTNIKRNGKNFGVRIAHTWIGTYSTVEEAIAARDAARIAMGL
jgi:hypothetical protein